MAFFRKIKAGLVQNEISEFIGEEGNIFFNVETGEFRLSDGITPGGLPLSTGSNGNATRAAFIINATTNTGIVSNKQYKPNIIPTDAVLLSADTDNSTIDITVGVEGGNETYTPAVTVNNFPVSNLIKFFVQSILMNTI